MTIGLPRALFYFRYGCLWENFFRFLGCNVVVGEETNPGIVADGIRNSVDETCLPLKVFMGQVMALNGRCDYILVPRFERLEKNDEFCVRFFGLYDTVRNTFGQAGLLSYNVEARAYPAELTGLLQAGIKLNKNPAQVLWAYRRARQAQQIKDQSEIALQSALLKRQGVKILLAAQPYILHDPCLGGPIARIIREQGGVPVYSDRFDRAECRSHAKDISRDLYWIINKEIIGAIAAQKEKVDGVILLTAFPCGTDSLVNELVLRRVRDIPIIQIIMDEQQGEAGLQTRIESFLDMLNQRKK